MPDQPGEPLRPLPANEAHVWLWRLGASPLPDDLAATLLDAAERQRLTDIETTARADEFLRGRVLLRHTLTGYAPVAPPAWRFTAEPAGRLTVVGPAAGRGLCVSLSHTRGLVGCAVCRDHHLGLDLEDARRPVRALEIAERFFAPEERDRLRRLPEEPRTTLFFELWTAKEARLKAEGRTLADTLGRAPRGEGAPWLCALDLPAPHVGALVVVGGPLAVRIHPFEGP